MRPVVAIVGRPNVGKSSLLNKFVGRRVSIVDPTPGVTRDRVVTLLTLDAPTETPKGTPEIVVECMDTGGFGVYTAEGARFDDVGKDLAELTPDIEAQIARARQESDVILFVVDAQTGLTALDRTVARLIRQEGVADRVIVVANKVDGPNWEAPGLEASALGLGEPTLCSTTNGHGMRKLRERMWFVLNEAGHPQPEVEASSDVRFAIVGKRNAGKSSLLNALCGEERAIVSDIAGTTRDAVDVRIEYEGRGLIAVDTAGLRKRKSFADDIEHYAYFRMLDAIRRADVAILVIDATEPVSSVDRKLAAELVRLAKPTLLVVNKTDLVDPAEAGAEKFAEYLAKELKAFNFAPIVFAAAAKSEGVGELSQLVLDLYDQARERMETGPLNAAFEAILKERGPSCALGTRAKIYFVSQTSVAPPTIVCKVNKPELFEGGYRRYLENRLRELVPFPEVPFVVDFVTRSRKSVHELRTAGRRAEHDAAKKLDEFLSEELDLGDTLPPVEDQDQEKDQDQKQGDDS